MGGGFLFTDDISESPSDYKSRSWQIPSPSPASSPFTFPSPHPEFSDNKPKFQNSSKHNDPTPSPKKTLPRPPSFPSHNLFSIPQFFSNPSNSNSPYFSHPPNFPIPPNFPNPSNFPIPPNFSNPSDFSNLASFLNPSSFPNPSFPNFFDPFVNNATYSTPETQPNNRNEKDSSSTKSSSSPTSPGNGSKGEKKESRSPSVVTPVSPSPVGKSQPSSSSSSSSSIPLPNDSKVSKVLEIPVKSKEEKVEQKDEEKGEEKVNERVEAKVEETCGKLDPVSSITKIQSLYRGYRVRQTEPLKYLRILSKGRKDLERLKGQLSDSIEVQKLRNDSKGRMKMSEALMGVLLRLDTVQCANGVVRDFRKSLTRQAIALMDSVDSLSQEETIMGGEKGTITGGEEETMMGGEKDKGSPCEGESSGNCDRDLLCPEKTSACEVSGCRDGTQCFETGVEEREEQVGGKEKEAAEEEIWERVVEKQGGGEGNQEELEGKLEEMKEKEEGVEKEIILDELLSCEETDNDLQDKVPVQSETDNRCAGSPLEEREGREDVREGQGDIEGERKAEMEADRKEGEEITEESNGKKIGNIVVASLLAEEGSAELIGQLLENLMKQNRLLKAEVRKGEVMRAEQTKIASRQEETIAELSKRVDMLTEALLAKDKESSYPITNPLFVVPAVAVEGGVKNLGTGRKREMGNKIVRSRPSPTMNTVPGKMKRKILNPYPHFAFA